MNNFVLLIQVDDFDKISKDLVEVKRKIHAVGEITVIEVNEDTLNFLLNSLIERAVAIKKGRS